uniref:hypothetical protein n=1 Tax=Bacteroides sp. OM05-12 TaxID=2292283 RepID=UPI000E83D42D
RQPIVGLLSLTSQPKTGRYKPSSLNFFSIAPKSHLHCNQLSISNKGAKGDKVKVNLSKS